MYPNTVHLRTRVYRVQMLGSILSNLLLVLGCSFLAGMLVYQFHESVRSLRTRKAGIRKHESEFAVKAAQTLYFAFPLQQCFRTDTIHPQECFGENPPYFNSSIH
jgi:hypothetical protein